MERLASRDAAALDPFKFMALIGKRVIHPGGRASTEALLRRAAITAELSVLDIGCGVGTTAIEITKRHRAAATTVDIAPLMLERASHNVKAANEADHVSVDEGDILALSYPDNSFHVVVAEAVTMLVDRAELARVCKPGGRVLATAHVRKMAWLMPKMAKAVPFLGYVLVCGTQPAKVA